MDPRRWLPSAWPAGPLRQCGGLCREAADTEFPDGRTVSLGAAVLRRNMAVAQLVMKAFLSELRQQCLEEKEQYARQSLTAPQSKQNRWALYTCPSRERALLVSALRHIRDYAECRVTLMAPVQLRTLSVFQHLVEQDTLDICSPEKDRRHGDTFEGILTVAGVNSQLVKDAHRSEWSIDGTTFSALADEPADGDRKAAIAAFRRDLVTRLEEFLIDYCRRQKLSSRLTTCMMQAVTTQMSQCGLANLERCSRSAQIFVSGQGLEQRLAYNLSLMDSKGRGEELKLSIYCMKRGFSSYHTPESMAACSSGATAEEDLGPMYCSPESYLYQYATLCFGPSLLDDGERVECNVVDLLDEVCLEPVGPL